MKTFRMGALRHVVIAGAVAAALAMPAAEAAEQQGEPNIFSLVTPAPAPSFDTADAAVDALRNRLASDDFDGLAALFGLDAAKLRAGENVMDTYTAIREGAARQLVVQDLGADRKIIAIGDVLWPLPFPLVKDASGKWAFDTEAGLEEIINRRVGANELETIQTMHAYVDAQFDYARTDHDEDGVLEYARKLISSPGMTDGLYWPAEQGDGESPAGAFADASAIDKARKGQGYFGYRYRILTRQGDKVAGGAYDYVINGNMIAGFALLAWPVKYAETGVYTFAVNHQGVVYQIDLGPATGQIVKYIDAFDPDKSWELAE